MKSKRRIYEQPGPPAGHQPVLAAPPGYAARGTGGRGGRILLGHHRRRLQRLAGVTVRRRRRHQAHRAGDQHRDLDPHPGDHGPGLPQPQPGQRGPFRTGPGQHAPGVERKLPRHPRTGAPVPHAGVRGTAPQAVERQPRFPGEPRRAVLQGLRLRSARAAALPTSAHLHRGRPVAT